MIAIVLPSTPDVDGAWLVSFDISVGFVAIKVRKKSYSKSKIKIGIVFSC
jgi:hypothetical protein